MTPAPISVERFDLYGVSYVRATDHDASIAALLHQLAELEAEAEQLREELDVANTSLGQATADCVEQSFRAEAAERAREKAERDLRAIYEVVPGLPIYATEEDADRATDAFTAICHLCNEYIASDAAFLAASGGK